MSSHSRRQYLRLLAGAGALSGVAAGTAAASHPETQPEYVTLSYDKALIQQHQPLLYLDGVENPPQEYHALVAESTESELDVVVGFHRYSYQAGVDPLGRDSHLGDREPFYIYQDGAGNPVKVQYSAYHWYEHTVYWQDVHTDEEDKRPLVGVAPRWHHHYLYRGERDADSEETLPVKNLLESYPSWLDNGLESEIHPGAVYNPQEEMQPREHWWKDGAQTWEERALASVFLLLGIRGADSSDLDGGLW